MILDERTPGVQDQQADRGEQPAGNDGRPALFATDKLTIWQRFLAEAMEPGCPD